MDAAEEQAVWEAKTKQGKGKKMELPIRER